MRGETTLKDMKENAAAAQQKRGRNTEYVVRRNECLIDRYYYYSNFTDKRYESVINLLSGEFFISVRTITDLLPNHREQLQCLKTKRPAISYFTNRWPHIKW